MRVEARGQVGVAPRAAHLAWLRQHLSLSWGFTDWAELAGQPASIGNQPVSASLAMGSTSTNDHTLTAHMGSEDQTQDLTANLRPTN